MSIVERTIAAWLEKNNKANEIVIKCRLRYGVILVQSSKDGRHNFTRRFSKYSWPDTYMFNEKIRMPQLAVAPLETFQLASVVEIRCNNFINNRVEVLQSLKQPLKELNVWTNDWEWIYTRKPSSSRPSSSNSGNRGRSFERGGRRIRASESNNWISHFFLVPAELEWRLLKQPHHRIEIEKIEKSANREPIRFSATMSIPAGYTPGETIRATGFDTSQVELRVKKEIRKRTYQCDPDDDDVCEVWQDVEEKGPPTSKRPDDAQEETEEVI